MAKSRTLSYAEAIREGLAVAMQRDDSVFLMGEGIADSSSFFGTTIGIVDEFGAHRVVEMPVAENGLTGVAIGAALMGERPVISLHRVEFALLAFEQIVNNAAKTHYVSNGLHKVPLVIRMIVGRGWGQGPEHSQSLESIFAHIPGLKVMMPTFPADAKGMLIAAIEDDNPVISIEHRWLYNGTGEVAEGYQVATLDGPRVIFEGDDVTVVATSYMTLEALRAARVLEQFGCSVEVIDLRVLRPLNIEPIGESVEKTGRLLTVDTGWRTYGIGAEVTAAITNKFFAHLVAAPVRLGLPDHPTPSSRGLVTEFYPNAEHIIREVGPMTGMAKGKIEAAQAELARERGDQPIDTPDPYFKGPF